MPDYQVIARKFRPQTFKEVLGQEAIVATLKNAIHYNRLAQAYLFCGSRGTGKTTLARILAKALNCENLSDAFEPCNSCSSCREIGTGSSLDVMEIDGASHRGIEDIRQINDTVGYAAASGRYKIYIIDEVHMLTKEAFNALLKTLEEPPPKVIFLFATTEPHKVLPTILSRCQRFNLSRIPAALIQSKLTGVAKELGVEVEEGALQLIAQRAEGGLRDAESLFDQVIAFSSGKITSQNVQSILGIMPKEAFLELDRAGKEGRFEIAFEIAHRLFADGKDLIHFVEGLIDHFRQILLIQLSGKSSSLLTLSSLEREQYEQTARLYTQEQCLDLIDYLLESTQKLRFAVSGKMALEAILLHVMRSHFRLPIEALVRRLCELEKNLEDLTNQKEIPPAPPLASTLKPIPVSPLPPLPAKVLPKVISETPKPSVESKGIVNEDPTPTPADLGLTIKTAKPPAALKSSISTPKGPAYKYDTLFQFAAIELEGRLKRKA